SCNDEILRSMSRPYTIEEFKNRVAYIRERIPDISISTDLIVGFPGEDEERFEDTLKNLKEIRFSFIHVFPYSRKRNTVADRMEGHIDPKIKKARVKAVMDLEKEISEGFRKTFVGKTVKVLIERTKDGFSYGYCRQYFYVKVNGELNIGDLYDVVIDSVNEEVYGHVA
nr:radical SAM protein [Erysipelotrichaceae bacterium]